MDAPQPTRWRRRDARRRSSIRRLLLLGGLTGLAAGLLAQFAVNAGDHPTDFEWIVRLALVLPAVIFFVWWKVFPSAELEDPVVPVEQPIDASERLERIEATFDSAAVPRARRHEVEPVGEASHATYRSSVGRDRDSVLPAPSSFGVRRPARSDLDAHTRDADTGS